MKAQALSPLLPVSEKMTNGTQRRRTLASAVTYRVASTLLLMVITYAVAGQLFESAMITLSFALLATVVFYMNDRAWERTDWGKKTS
jgi:uncharacterized membrane protein